MKSAASSKNWEKKQLKIPFPDYKIYYENTQTYKGKQQTY